MKLKIMIMALLLLLAGIGSAVNRMPATEFAGDIDFMDGFYARNTTEGVFNVRDYGAVGDGATDDGPAINATIEAAYQGYVSTGNMQVVWTPPGNYKIGGRYVPDIGLGIDILIAPRPGLKFYGSGMGASRWIAPDAYRNATQGVSLLFNDVEQLPNFEIRDMTFDYGTEVFLTGDAFATRIGATYCRDVKILNVEFLNASGSWGLVLGPGSEDNWSHGFEVAGCVFREVGTVKSGDETADFCSIYMNMGNGSIHDNRFINSAMPVNATSAIELHNSNITAHDNFIYNYRQGIHCGAIKDTNSTSTGQLIQNNHIVAYDGIMLWCSPSGSHISDMTIIGNKIQIVDGPDGQGVNQVDAFFTGTGDNIFISGNDVERIGGRTGNSPGIMMGEFRNITIKNNKIHGFTRGIQIEDVPDPVLIDVFGNSVSDFGAGLEAGRYTTGICILPLNSGSATGDLVMKNNVVQGDGTAQNPYAIYLYNTNMTRSWVVDNTVSGAQIADFIIDGMGALVYLDHVSQLYTAPAYGSNGSLWTDLSTGTIYRRTGGAWVDAFA